MHNCHCKCSINHMYPCTTPTLTFHVNFPLYEISDEGDVVITFAQRGLTIFVKEGQDVGIDYCGNVILVELSSEDTKKFKVGLDLQIQILIKLDDEKKIVSNEIHIPVSRLLSVEVEENG